MGGGAAGGLDARALDALLRSAPRVHRPLLVGLYLFAGVDLPWGIVELFCSSTGWPLRRPVLHAAERTIVGYQ